MKKVFSWILSLALIFSLLPNQVFAASTLEFSSEKEGEKIVVTLTLPKYEKVMAAEAVVEFSDALKLESVTSGTYSPLDFEEPNVETATSKGKVTIGHSNETLDTATIEGEYAKLTFSIKDGTAPGSYDIKLTELTMTATDYTTNIAASDAATLPKTISVVVPKAPITSVTIADLEAPVKGGTPDTSVTVTPSGLVADVKWFDGETQVTGNFAASTKYTVKIKLTASGGDNFAETVTAGGYTVTRNSETELLLTKTFHETDEKTLRGIDIITNPALEVAVPTAAPNATATKERSLAVTGVYDDGSGGPVAVTWEIITAIPDGVSLDGNILKVSNKAEAGTFTIKATYTDGSTTYTDSETVTIKKDGPVATAIVATAPATGTNITIPNGGTATSGGNCSYKVYDQYGAEMTGSHATWKMKLEPADVTGVTLIPANGSISVTNAATTCKATLYAESGTLKSNEITFNIARAASVATSLTIEGSADSVNVPTVTEPGTTSCEYATYTAKVKDQYGAEMTGQTIEWSVTDKPGVTFNNGQLTVTNKADAGTVTITATFGTFTATKTVTINKDAAKVSIVKITAQDNEPPVTIITCTGSQRSESYTATVYDQYGKEIQEDVTWSLDPTTYSGVNYEISATNDNIVTLTVAPNTAAGTFKLVATSKTVTTVKGELEIKVQKKNNVSSNINFDDGSLTYKGEGQKYEKASVTAGEGGTWTYTYAANGGTASLDGGLPKTVGTYTVTATYEDNSNIGSKSATLTITPKKVSIPAVDNTEYTYDGTEKTYKIPTSPDYTVSGNKQTNAYEGGYIVTVTLTDIINTTWPDGSAGQQIFMFKIMKATPTGEPSYTKITADGKTLLDTPLTIGTLQPDVIGYQLHWVDNSGNTLANDTKVEKNQPYKWLFTPVDTANYNTLTGSLTPYYVAPSSGGSYVPTVQKPEITIIGSGKADLSADGRTATITAVAGHELVSVVLNGKEMGKVEKLTGLKTGDKATITFQAKTDGKAEMDKMIAQKASKLTLMARSAKTAKKNIKVVVRGDLKAITDAGYTVKYKFYRSTKKSAGYKAVLTKKAPTYFNTYGKKGTMYYYKARVMIYDKDGNFVAQTALKQCKYANRLWTK